jgi:hypothetical protein
VWPQTVLIVAHLEHRVGLAIVTAGRGTWNVGAATIPSLSSGLLLILAQALWASQGASSGNGGFILLVLLGVAATVFRNDGPPAFNHPPPSLRHLPQAHSF